MKRLTKDQEERRDALIDELSNAAGAVGAAVSAFNEAMDAHRQAIEDEVARYNEAVRQAETLKSEIQDDIQNVYDDHSERWQESVKGQAHQAWIDAFEGLDLPELEVELPEAVEEPPFEALANLEDSWQPEV